MKGKKYKLPESKFIDITKSILHNYKDDLSFENTTRIANDFNAFFYRFKKEELMNMLYEVKAINVKLKQTSLLIAIITMTTTVVFVIASLLNELILRDFSNGPDNYVLLIVFIVMIMYTSFALIYRNYAEKIANVQRFYFQLERYIDLCNRREAQAENL